LVAAEMGLSESEAELVKLAGLLHDPGEPGFPDSLFLPHEGDNPKEIVREITRHPATGAEILKDLDFPGAALPYIRCHHERPDGRGYPEHLKGADIPLGARIIAVADAFDAIATPPVARIGIGPRSYIHPFLLADKRVIKKLCLFLLNHPPGRDSRLFRFC
jgi:HD-GYP domain-containing protein (c-di-GMP phosphodiesterase class II)